MSQSGQLPAQPEHCVHLYGADVGLLSSNVARYLCDGLEHGDGLLVIATAEHAAAFVRDMERAGADPSAAMGNRQLVFLDAQDAPQRFMTGGQSDWALFEQAIEGVIGDIRPAPGGGLRAYGEIVGVLWQAGKYSAAIRLEQFWNRLLGVHSFRLYCAYPIDIFSAEFQLAALEALLCAHTSVAPGGNAADLENAINRSMDEQLGRRAEGLRGLMEMNFLPSRAAISRAEANIFWLRNNIPDEAESILDRARLYYQASHRQADAAGQPR